MCPGNMAGSLWRAVSVWGKTFPCAIGLAHPNLTRNARGEEEQRFWQFSWGEEVSEAGR